MYSGVIDFLFFLRDVKMIVLLLTDYVRDDCMLGVRGSSSS